ncbi:hypothetical protein DAEQUDRAFT_129384 [Daedalea quercina L-15889]|uniref:Uncharacterized protein n=1 Tax=Daedalea quercina L-15889 TaxID=1314783 RepID=A0A165S176_9APHY|nr:hypothetical protein DAEQUDRAFT_129384 [Daedalea quercina L-15889]
MSNWGDNAANWSGEQVGGAEGDVQRFDNSVNNAFDNGVQDVADAPDDAAHWTGDKVRPPARVRSRLIRIRASWTLLLTGAASPGRGRGRRCARCGEGRRGRVQGRRELWARRRQLVRPGRAAGRAARRLVNVCQTCAWLSRRWGLVQRVEPGDKMKCVVRNGMYVQ